MGLWIGPPGAVLGAICLGYAAYALYREEQQQGAQREQSLPDTKDGTALGTHARGGEIGRWKPIALAALSCVAIVPFTWAFIAGSSDVLLRECEMGAVLGTGRME